MGVKTVEPATRFSGGAVGKFLFRRRALGDGDVAGGFDELLELFVGDFRRVHPEAVHVNAMHGQRVARHAGQTAQ